MYNFPLTLLEIHYVLFSLELRSLLVMGPCNFALYIILRNFWYNEERKINKMPPLPLEGEGIHSSHLWKENWTKMLSWSAELSLFSLVPETKDGPRTGLVKGAISHSC